MEGKRQRLAERPDIILNAADAVLRQKGSRALTIDAVAAAAGLSKGGVLHHYASKDALILALVARKLRDLGEGIASCQTALAAGPDQLPRVLVAHARATYGDDDEFSRALLLASVENPEALDGYRAFVADQLARLGSADPRSKGEGFVLFFSVLGLIMGRTLGFHVLGAEELSPMFEALERIAEAASSAQPMAENEGTTSL